MSRRKQLRGIAANLLGSFVSRNNDVNGYWAIGKLYSLAGRHRVQTVTVDILAPEMAHDSTEVNFVPMLDKYSSMLAAHLARAGIATATLTKAAFELSFDGAVTEAPPASGIPGLPFRCAFTLIDAAEHAYSATHLGAARPHDPAKETQSTRAKREQLLLDVLTLSRPIRDIWKELAEFKWDSRRELVILNRSHLKATLKSFVAGNLAASDVKFWANAVEGREDIGFEAGHAELLKSAVFRLANPIITETLNVPAATHLIDELSR